MSKLNFDYVPLTFIADKQEIKKQIRNTLILIHLFEKFNNPVRLEKLIVGTQYGYNASALQSGNNKFLRISDIHDSKVNWDSVPYCNCDDEETYLLKNEDILIARTGGTTGKSFKIDSPPKHSIYAGYLIRIRAKKEVNPDYIYLFLHSFAYWSQIVNLNERNFRPKANAENLKSLILPDCERNIQDEAVRISQSENIKGYEDLFSEIEKALSEYDKTQQVENLLSDQLTQLENLNQAILQEAVQGKLLSESELAGLKDEPDYETGQQLLERIKAEKNLANPKIKKILIPTIKKEEIPFDIPENWVWCRLGEIAYITSGSTPSKEAFVEKGIPYLKMYNLRSQEIDFHYKPQFIKEEVHNGQLKRCRAYPGDILMNIVGPPLGKIAIIPNSLPECNFNQAAVLIRPYKKEMNYYINYFLNEMSEIKAIETKGVAGQDNISVTQSQNIKIPLPPLSEQKRIVAEIEKQLAKTKQLKEHIIANQQATEQLLKALLHQAFEVEEMEEV